MVNEVKRQLFHLLFGSVLIAGIFFGFLVWWHFAILLLCGYALSLLSLRWRLPFIAQALDHFDRKGQFIPGWGALALVKGFLIATLLFPPRLALAALGIVVAGDAFATIVGVRWGAHRLPWQQGKSVEGTIAGFVAGLAAALLFVPWPLALVGALVGMVVETAYKPHPVFDDNILIPLVSGVLMLVLLPVV